MLLVLSSETLSDADKLTALQAELQTQREQNSVLVRQREIMEREMSVLRDEHAECAELRLELKHAKASPGGSRSERGSFQADLSRYL